MRATSNAGRPGRHWLGGLLATLLIAGPGFAGEPDPSTYWDVKDLRPGMKGTGRTVMVGTRLEDFGAEVLGVMRDVSPGRDMVLCRLTGCNLEHAGIIQGMSGSPIWIDGKLLGAVAFAWEFAKDPIAGVTPFQQMVQYVRSNDRRIAAEAKDPARGGAVRASAWSLAPAIEGIAGEGLGAAGGLSLLLPALSPSSSSAGGSMAGMRPVTLPLAASGFTPRALSVLEQRFRPLGMAPLAGGAAPEHVVKEAGNKPLAAGDPLSIAMVMGDFDLCGIGTVTHVEGDRVYGFGHPMLSLGACEFPMMSGYIHTVYPRASVSMKMGSPLKVVGVVDTDVSTGVAGTIGRRPDLLPVTVKVKAGRYSDPKTYRVKMVREPVLLPGLLMAVLTNAIDTEGNLPEELTVNLRAEFQLEGREPIRVEDMLSGPRYTGPMGPAAIFFRAVSSIAGILVRNPMAPVRIEGIECAVELERGRKVASLESVRLLSDRIEPGKPLRAFATLKPFKGDRQVVELSVPIPDDFPEGTHEATFCDLGNSVRRRFRNDPTLAEPHDLEAILAAIRMQTEPRRTSLFAHVQTPERGLAVQGQELTNLPASVRAAFASRREVPVGAIRSDLVGSASTPWVVEGSQALRFTVAKDAGVSLSLK